MEKVHHPLTTEAWIVSLNRHCSSPWLIMTCILVWNVHWLCVLFDIDETDWADTCTCALWQCTQRTYGCNSSKRKHTCENGWLWEHWALDTLGCVCVRNACGLGAGPHAVFSPELWRLVPRSMFVLCVDDKSTKIDPQRQKQTRQGKLYVFYISSRPRHNTFWHWTMDLQIYSWVTNPKTKPPLSYNCDW